MSTILDTGKPTAKTFAESVRFLQIGTVITAHFLDVMTTFCAPVREVRRWAFLNKMLCPLSDVDTECFV